MTDDEERRQKAERLKELMKRVPPHVLSAGTVKTRNYLDDVADAAKARSPAKIREAVAILETWWRGETPHYHPEIK